MPTLTTAALSLRLAALRNRIETTPSPASKKYLDLVEAELIFVADSLSWVEKQIDPEEAARQQITSYLQGQKYQRMGRAFWMYLRMLSDPRKLLVPPSVDPQV